ncbi:MAG TPA: SGNH/GDSL hydrolase family protein [Acidobacteriaceae bacterium]
MRLAASLTMAMLSTALMLHAQAPAPQADPAKAAPLPQAYNPHDHALAQDFGQLGRYRAANQQLPAPTPDQPRVLFYGDSITDGWKLDQFFPGKGYINRGIGGQTTPQMLVRLRQDVIDLEPQVLVLLAGTNDLAGNTGPMTIEQTEENFTTIAELARLHHIALIFSSITPVNNYIHPDMLTGRPLEKILALNTWLKSYCQANHLIYLDYYPSMVDAQGELQKPLSNDGLHPNAAGYAIMAPLAQQAITAGLAQPSTP